MLKKKLIAAAVAITSAFGINIITAPANAAAAELQTGKVVKSVSFRTAPSVKTGKHIRYLQTGETFQILDKVNAGYWYKIKDKNDRIGYVSSLSRYVTVTSTPAPVPAPVEPPKPEPNPAPKPEAWEQKADEIIAYGMKYLDVPYVFGGGRKDDSSFDCSGFVSWVFNHNGVKLTKAGARTQAQYGTFVPRDQLRKGDLVFSDTNHDGLINHVSIYIGDNKLLHTYKVGIGVVVTRFEGSSWDNGYITARRYF